MNLSFTLRVHNYHLVDVGNDNIWDIDIWDKIPNDGFLNNGLCVVNLNDVSTRYYMDTNIIKSSSTYIFDKYMDIALKYVEENGVNMIRDKQIDRILD